MARGVSIQTKTWEKHFQRLSLFLAAMFSPQSTSLTFLLWCPKLHISGGPAVFSYKIMKKKKFTRKPAKRSSCAWLLFCRFVYRLNRLRPSPKCTKFSRSPRTRFNGPCLYSQPCKFYIFIHQRTLFLDRGTEAKDNGKWQKKRLTSGAFICWKHVHKSQWIVIDSQFSSTATQKSQQHAVNMRHCTSLTSCN